jgi:hypothetical protein
MARKKTKQQRPRSPGWKVQVLGKRKARHRMSETLIDFAQPELLREDGSVEEWQFELSLAALVWNGVLIGKTSEELLETLCEVCEPDLDLAVLITSLVRRRQTAYAQDRRMIVAVRAYPLDDGYGVHVLAASTVL